MSKILPAFAAMTVWMLVTGFWIQAFAADTCSKLSNLKFPDTTIVSAAVIPAGGFRPPGGMGDFSDVYSFKAMPQFCRVVLEIRPTADSHIGVEVWMPTDHWNGRFQGQGNGGYAGSILYSFMASAVTGGYATAGTDTGHTGSALDSHWAVGHPEQVVDFGYRAVHEMTARAKDIINAFYDRPAEHSYFSSCSDGGREALMEAQRYPMDYDGIIAGDPANNWTRLFTDFVYNAVTLHKTPDSSIPPSELPAISAAVLDACDGQEGIKDGLLNDPPACHFEPFSLLCKGTKSEGCLTAPQVKALEQIYEGGRTESGKEIYPGFVPGGELGPGGWDTWILNENSSQVIYGEKFYQDMVFENHNWNYLSINFDHALHVALEKVGPVLDANNSNLEPFRKNGGKLILYQGWSDAAVSPLNTISYYNSVLANSGEAADSFVRLYLVPGLQHCTGGSGATTFGQLGSSDADSSESIFAALVKWVETNTPPAQITASKYELDFNGKPKTVFTRPLCAYPTRTVYRGVGDVNDAKSFSCVK